MKKGELLAAKVQKLFDACESDPDLRTDPAAFTRHRRLGPKRILLILLRRMVLCLQLALDEFFKFSEEEPVTKQALSKARKGLNPEFVRKFPDLVGEVHAADPDAPSYKGMRLVAMDGTDIALENSEELRKVFGCSGRQKNAATALGSIAYGPLDHAIYDCQIASYATDERDLAKLHMTRLLELGLGGSLLLFDRWYPSREFIAYTLEQGFSFVMRVREKWNLDVDAMDKDGIVSITYHGQNNRIRVIKVLLPTGETETLLTNLTDQQLPAEEAGELYFKRWGIETAYDAIKSKLQLENFSGKTEISVKQDFYATVFLMGFAEICAREATEVIETADTGKSLKYARKASMNRTIAKLRDEFWTILLEHDPDVRHAMFVSLYSKIASYPEPIRSGRSPIRNNPRKKRFPIAKKAVLP